MFYLKPFKPRDTLILPCRHLAVCAECAEKIRYQQAACPICRKPFKALLKLHIPNVDQESLMDILNSIPNEFLKKCNHESDRKSPEEPGPDPKINKESNNNNSKSPKEAKKEDSVSKSDANLDTSTSVSPETEISEIDPAMPKVRYQIF